MAITFGSPIGSTSPGSFSILPAQVESGDTVTLLAVGETGGVEYGDVLPDCFTITEAQAIGIQSLLTALIDNGGGDYASNELSYLRKLVGLVSLTNGQTITLGISTEVVGSRTLSLLNATCSDDGTVVMYVPNSASAGLYTGPGADSIPAPIIPAVQRQDAVANVPGLPLSGAVCMAVPNAVGAPAINLSETLSSGYAQTGATADTDFIVEKIDMADADPGPGLGTLMFAFRFAAGGESSNQQATIEFASTDLEVPAGWLYRVVNPNPADATLADVAMTVAGTLSLV